MLTIGSKPRLLRSDPPARDVIDAPCPRPGAGRRRGGELHKIYEDQARSSAAGFPQKLRPQLLLITSCPSGYLPHTSPNPRGRVGLVAPETEDLSPLNQRFRTAESEITVHCNNRHLAKVLLERLGGSGRSGTSALDPFITFANSVPIKIPYNVSGMEA